MPSQFTSSFQKAVPKSWSFSGVLPGMAQGRLSVFNEVKSMTKDFSKLAGEMPDGVAITTLEGTVVYWNSAAESLFGYPQAEAVEKRFNELIHLPAEKFFDLDKDSSDLSGTHCSVRGAVCKRKDGTFINVSISAKVLPFEHPEENYLLLSGKEITQLTAGCEAESIGRKFSNVLDCMPDGIVMVNSTAVWCWLRKR